MKKIILSCAFIFCISCVYAADLSQKIMAAEPKTLQKLTQILNREIEKSKEKQDDSVQKKQKDDLVFFLLWDNKKEELASACTGTLIKAGWVLTAAHCFLPCRNDNCDILPVFPERQNTKALLDIRENKDFFLQPDYCAQAKQGATPKELLETAQYDIAVLKIEGLTPASYKKLTVLKEGPQNAFMLIHRLISKKPAYIIKEFPFKFIYDTVFATSQGFSEINPGDSGAALFTENGEIVAVMNSFFARAGAAEPGFNIFTPITEKNLNFIEATAK